MALAYSPGYQVINICPQRCRSFRGCGHAGVNTSRIRRSALGSYEAILACSDSRGVLRVWRRTTSAHALDVMPALVTSTGRGRPPKPRYRDDPSNLRDRDLAAARDASVEVTWRHSADNPTAAMTSTFLAIKVRPANRENPQLDRWHPAHPVATRRIAQQQRRASRLPAVEYGRRHAL